jgi:hypothetical protein
MTETSCHNWCATGYTQHSETQLIGAGAVCATGPPLPFIKPDVVFKKVQETVTLFPRPGVVSGKKAAQQLVTGRRFNCWLKLQAHCLAYFQQAELPIDQPLLLH